MTLSVNEILIRVKRQFGDESGAQITDADILRWINDAQRDIALSNDLLQSRARTALTRGLREYSLPPDVLTLRSVRFNDRKLRALSAQEAEVYIDQPHMAPTLEPQVFWLWANKINVFPTPAVNDPDDLQIFYTRQPLVVSQVTDVPELPSQYHNRIVEYCLKQAYELDENWAAAGVKGQEWNDKLSDMKGREEWAQRDFYPSITSLPSDVD